MKDKLGEGMGKVNKGEEYGRENQEKMGTRNLGIME